MPRTIGPWIGGCTTSLERTVPVAWGQFISNWPRLTATWMACCCEPARICWFDWHADSAANTSSTYGARESFIVVLLEVTGVPRSRRTGADTAQGGAKVQFTERPSRHRLAAFAMLRGPTGEPR